MFDKTVKTPFNIDLLILDKKTASMLQPVTKTNIFTSKTQNFEPDGLFSTSIFGQVGSDARNNTFGYIDLHIDVFHPLLFQHVSTLRSFYKDIMMGKKYAKYDKTIKDLVPATIDDGETGFTYFVNILPSIKLEGNGSDQREFKIKLLNMYKDNTGMVNKWLVLPAGMRDYTVDESGKASEDEVNDIYRKLISTTNILNSIKITPSNEYTIDGIKVKIQLLVNELYEHYRGLLDGKNKFILGKFAKRAVVNGTRNVITPSISNITNIDQENKITADDTIVGLYQYTRGIAPIAMNKIHTTFINKFLSPETTTGKLVDMKTLKTKLVNVNVKKRDEWTTLEGLDETIGKLEQEELRHLPIVIDGNYLCLVHDRNNVITIIEDTNNMDESFEPKFIRPITYYEMIYISIYDIRNKYPAFLTRYPVAGLGGVYPSKLYVRTTENPRTVTVKMGSTERTMYEFPKLGQPTVSSLSPSPSHIERLTADYDGDTVSLNILYTDDSIKEINDMLDDKKFYITPDGDITYSIVSDTLKYVVGYMSKDPIGELSIEEFDESYTDGYMEISLEDINVDKLMPILDDDLIDGYKVDDLGNVYRTTTRRNGKTVTKLLKLHTTKLGYVEAILTKKDGKKKHLQVHRLVAMHHIGMPDDDTLTDVNHMDGDRSNSTVGNLEWSTHSANVKHSYDHLRGK